MRQAVYRNINRVMKLNETKSWVVHTGDECRQLVGESD
jgi:hypothetical protein